MENLDDAFSFASDCGKLFNTNSRSTATSDTPNSIKEALITNKCNKVAINNVTRHSDRSKGILFTQKLKHQIHKRSLKSHPHEIFSGVTLDNQKTKSRLLWKKVVLRKAHSSTSRAVDRFVHKVNSKAVMGKGVDEKNSENLIQQNGLLSNKMKEPQLLRNSKKIMKLTKEYAESEGSQSVRFGSLEINFNRSSILQDLQKFKTLRVVL